MIKQYWEQLSGKIDELSLRERALIFGAAAFTLVTLINMLFLDPLLTKQRQMSSQVVQQQEKMKEIQSQIEALLQAKRDDASSPLRQRLAQLKQQLAEGNAYVKGRSDRLVPSDKMADVLEQMLNKNGRLQLVSLKTLPVAPLMDKVAGKANNGNAANQSKALEKQVFKHGVEITVSGSYLDMLQYLVALEHLPAQMFWGRAKLSVAQYPTAELTLTLYTLSLDKTWLVI
ncbi:MAG: agglutinin biogenesis protein [Sideroxydans sp.]|nr:agglutinin biogenesis protein [Sideroxydans sp.]